MFQVRVSCLRCLSSQVGDTTRMCSVNAVQSFNFYHNLKARNVPTKCVVLCCICCQGLARADCTRADCRAHTAVYWLPAVSRVLVYPNDDHSVTRTPASGADCILNTVRWFNKYLDYNNTTK